MSLFCLTIIATIGATSLPVKADDPQVRAGVAAFDELRYRDAVVLLERAIANVTLSRDDCIGAHGTLGRAYAVLGHETAARAAFVRALELEPTYLVGYDEPPAVTQAFQAARNEFERAHPGATHDMPALTRETRPRLWPWIAGGVAIVAIGVVTAILVTQHNDDGPSDVNDVWRLP